MTEEITNDQDIIDSRDILERIQYIEQLLEEGDLVTEEHDLEISALTEELESLQDLTEQCEQCGDWKYGETLIRDSYFEDYAQELAKDVGAIDRYVPWPLRHIDWSAAADELKNDYMLVNFDGEEYWIRA